MSAEDYWDGRDPWDDNDDDGYYSSGPARRVHTCKRCGKPDLLWHKTQTGWRLFTLNGVLHSCPLPSGTVTVAHKADLPTILSTTTQAFQSKE